MLETVLTITSMQTPEEAQAFKTLKRGMDRPPLCHRRGGAGYPQ